MDSSHIDSGHVRITEAAAPHVKKLDDDGVVVVVTQAFGPNGDNLVGLSDVTFDGYPAITLLVDTGERRGEVHISPIHGDDRKLGMTDIPSGTRCKLLCPVSQKPLDWAGDVVGDEGTRYYALYLTRDCDDGCMVAISDVWGHYHSRVVDNFELISQWLPEEEDADQATA